MAANLIVVLAAAGLVASAPQGNSTRSAAALPTSQQALVSPAKSVGAGSSCFAALGSKSLKQSGVKRCSEARTALAEGVPVAPVVSAAATTTTSTVTTVAVTVAAATAGGAIANTIVPASSK